MKDFVLSTVFFFIKKDSIHCGFFSLLYSLPPYDIIMFFAYFQNFIDIYLLKIYVM